MNHHQLLRGRLAVAFAACFAALPGLALAQSAYTAKLLTLPSGGGCSIYSGVLGSTGAAAVSCITPKKASLFGVFTNLYYALRDNEFSYLGSQEYYGRINEFKPDGTQRWLTAGSGTVPQAWVNGYLANGDLVGDVRNVGNVQYGSMVWRNGVGTLWTRPAALKETDWAVSSISPAGQAQVLARFTSTGRYELATVVNGLTRRLPALPEGCYMTAPDPGFDVVVADNGQVAHVHENRYMGSQPWQKQVCWWDGSTWTVAPTLSSATVPETGGDTPLGATVLNALSTSGELISNYVTVNSSFTLSWSAANGLSKIDSAIQAVGANDERLGGAERRYTSTGRATIWRNGVPFDLNSAAKLTGYTFRSVLATNTKGQVLVTLSTASKPQDDAHLAVLTPK